MRWGLARPRRLAPPQPAQHRRRPRPFLILVPLSTIHWSESSPLGARRVRRHLPGSADSRKIIVQNDWKLGQPKKPNAAPPLPQQGGGEPRRAAKGARVVARVAAVSVWWCSTYETVVADEPPAVRWQYLIVDEGHRLKNHSSRSIDVMCESAPSAASSSGHPANHVSGSGPPDFLEPAVWRALRLPRRFGALSSSTGTVQQGAQPRRCSATCCAARNPASRRYSRWSRCSFMEITNLQKVCYRAVLKPIADCCCAARQAAAARHRRWSAWSNVSMMLRHCCNHPWLIKEVEEGALAASRAMPSSASRTQRGARPRLLVPPRTGRAPPPRVRRAPRGHLRPRWCCSTSCSPSCVPRATASSLLAIHQGARPHRRLCRRARIEYERREGFLEPTLTLTPSDLSLTLIEYERLGGSVWGVSAAGDRPLLRPSSPSFSSPVYARGGRHQPHRRRHRHRPRLEPERHPGDGSRTDPGEGGAGVKLITRRTRCTCSAPPTTSSASSTPSCAQRASTPSLPSSRATYPPSPSSTTTSRSSRSSCCGRPGCSPPRARAAHRRLLRLEHRRDPRERRDAPSATPTPSAS